MIDNGHWDKYEQMFIAPRLDKINMIEFIDSRFEQYSNNGIEDMEIYITNCLTQPEPDFWTVISKYSSINNTMSEQKKMRTDHWLFWYDCYFPNLSSTRNEVTDLIQKSCLAMLENDTLNDEDFERLFAQYEKEIAKLL